MNKETDTCKYSPACLTTTRAIVNNNSAHIFVDVQYSL